jgi:hypothetical protein
MIHVIAVLALLTKANVLADILAILNVFVKSDSLANFVRYYSLI